MKFCKDCKHFKERTESSLNDCAVENLIDPVSGKQEYSPARWMRKHGPCGMNAVLFEPNEAHVEDLKRQERMMAEISEAKTI